MNPNDEQPIRGKLLIVDDESEILKALYRQFRRTYEVYTAESADAGLEIMREVPVEVVVSDQRMPGTTGTQFLRQVWELYPDTVRLLLTGYADVEAVIAAINDGHVFRYITKPWDPVELESIIQQAFERYRLAAENRCLVHELTRANAMLEQRVADRTAELASANQNLQEMVALKNEFMGIAAHDLRTPLSVIQGFASLLQRQRDIPPDEVGEYLEFINDSVREMIGMLDDLLSISEIESGKLRMRVAPVDAREYIERIARVNRRLAAQKEITLQVDLPDHLPDIALDGDRVQQVLNNLLSNAFKFSNPKTTVTIGAHSAEEGIRFFVRDQGPGIRAEEQRLIFNAFERASNRSTAGEHSTGLGLAICKRIVEASQGQIGVESAVGEGSLFYFVLPLVPQFELSQVST